MSRPAREQRSRISRPARELVVVALALGGITAFALAGCGGSSSPSAAGSSSSSSITGVPPTPPQDIQAEAAAEHFRNRYVIGDGRVSRLDQGGDTVGEGQAYGMLMAAAVGDQQRFDAIWGWTKDNLRLPSGLLSFLWKDGHVEDPEAASDADLDATRALLLGACRFNRPALRTEALHLADAIMRLEVGSFRGEPVLTAGPWAVKAPVTINPSYFSPATFEALRAATGDPRWSSLAASSRSITSALVKSPARLAPDWARLEGDRIVPIGSPSEPQSTPKFGFDAVRTLVRMAEDPDPAGRQIAARAWPVFEGQNPTALPVEHHLSGAPIGHTLNPVVLVAAAGAADAAGQVAARDGLLDAAEDLDRRFPTYYGAAWVALGRIMLTTKLLDICT
jgi:endoglucanase